MFGMIGGVIGLQQFLVNQEIAIREERLFNEMCESLPDEISSSLRSDRKARKELEIVEATDERRHRELCEAIRSTSFW